jgi:hypothetical protein
LLLRHHHQPLVPFPHFQAPLVLALLTPFALLLIAALALALAFKLCL